MLRLLERETAATPGRVEIQVGTPDPRYNFAACTRAEAFVPAGVRLWGRTRVGLRCTEGATLTLYVPAEVRVFSNALVATRPLPAGTVLAAGDVNLEEAEVSREPLAPMQDPAAAAGKVLARPLAAGQVLRAAHLRGRQAVAAGDTVKVVYAGEGFMVSTEGRALAAAEEAQTVRVQTGSGRVLTGTARPGRVVEVSF